MPAEENGSMMEDRDWNASNEVGCRAVLECASLHHGSVEDVP
jgi:hypothetical protein